MKTFKIWYFYGFQLNNVIKKFNETSQITIYNEKKLWYFNNNL